MAQRYGIERIDEETLDRWRADDNRTLYLFDVRDPPNILAGHVPGAISAPGGQLVQATDLYAGTLGARLVLVDDAGVRAVMTASWLKQMGWKDVFTFSASSPTHARITGSAENESLGRSHRRNPRSSAEELAALLARNEATVIDLSLSPNYRKEHIPGAWFAIRSRLATGAAEDSAARRTRADVRRRRACRPRGRRGARAHQASRPISAGRQHGVAAARLPFSTEPHMADDPVDVWLKPYERAGDTTGAMNEYLSWEVDLVTRIERDGTCNFTT